MSKFVYVTYIRTTPEKLWEALTSPQFQERYWYGMHQESDWKAGSSWKMLFSDGRVADSGAILESDPPRRVVMRWRNEFRPELTAEGDARCTYEIEPDGDICRLTISHENAIADSKYIGAVSNGWPRILSSLKTLLEGGAPFPRSHGQAPH